MATDRTRNALIPILVAVALGPSFTVDATADSHVVPQTVKQWVMRQNPPTRILVREDIDTMYCGHVQHAPGIISADFDGDGGQDFALLLVVGEGKKLSHWYGRTFQDFDMRVTVLMSTGRGTFQEIELERFEMDIPSIVMLEPQPAHQLTRGGLNPHKLDRPGFVWHYCGKSSSVIHWQDGELKRIWTSD